MTLITCPLCHQIGEYHRMCNFDAYVCDCGCEFYRNVGIQNEEYLIGKNPFNGCIIRQHHDPICPSCKKESKHDMCCDNDCGTWTCECNQEFYTVNGQSIAGHNPNCGTD